MFEKYSTKADETKISFTNIRPHLKGKSLINGHAQLIIQSITVSNPRKDIKEIGGGTGNGITELKQLLVQHTRNNHEKIGMIQEVRETFSSTYKGNKTILGG